MSRAHPEPSPETDPGPSPSSPPSDAGDSRPSSTGEHVAAIEPDIPGADDVRPKPEGGPEATDAGPGLLTRDQFREGLAKCQVLAGHVLQLRTLAAAPERPEYLPAADAAYDIIRDTPALHWLIMPGSIWLQRVVAISAYALPVAAGCRAELLERARAADAAASRSSASRSSPRGEGE